ncbi:MAG: MFS transporter [Sphingobium phenoxybenzoativorans]
MAQAEPTENSAWSEWRVHWRIVLAAAAGVGVCSLHYYALGAFMLPLQEEFGWSRAEISSGLLMTSFGMLIAGPLFGTLADRWSARKLALSGLALYCVALGLLGTVGSSLWSWYCAWAFLALAQGVAGFVVWTLVVASAFNRHRGLALALTMGGTAMASTIAPPLAHAIIAGFGWRVALWSLAAGGFLVAFPLAWRYFHDPRLEKGRPHAAPASRPQLSGLTFPQACKTRQFWQIIVSVAIMSCGVSALIVHLVPMLSDRGATPARAAAMAAMIGPSMFAGRLLSGVLLDRFPGSVVAAAFLLAPAAACRLLLGFDGEGWHGFLVAGLAGFTAGAEVDLIAYIASRYFGMRSYGAIYGLFGGVFAFGSGLAPLLAGAVFDHAGSYAPILSMLTPVMLFASFLMLTLGRYAHQPAPETGASPSAPLHI